MNRYKLFKAGVDVTGALNRLNNDKTLYEELLQKFKVETRFSDLLSALKNKDAATAFTAAHALRGETGNMGFNCLYELLCPLVEKLRVNDLSEADIYLEKLQAAYASLLEAIG